MCNDIAGSVITKMSQFLPTNWNIKSAIACDQSVTKIKKKELKLTWIYILRSPS